MEVEGRVDVEFIEKEEVGRKSMNEEGLIF